MATRFYTYATGTPSVSPSFSSVWNATTVDGATRRLLALDTPGDTGDSLEAVLERVATADEHLMRQFVSPPLDAISATFAAAKAAFRYFETDAKCNCTAYIIFRKCDEDGSNDTDIGVITNGTEFDTADYVNRYAGPTNLTDQAFSQGDRLVVEVGAYFNNTKDSDYTARFYTTDNHATTDLGENDTDTTAYNSWIETGDTFTEASGEPAAIKLGPMFTFA